MRPPLAGPLSGPARVDYTDLRSVEEAFPPAPIARLECVEYWVANTDLEWFRYLADRAPVDEVNFWSPSVTRPKRLPQGAPWIFKLANRNGGQIVGGAFFATFSAITPRFAWDAFGDLNGAPDYPSFLRAISGYSEHSIDGDATPVGSAILLQPFFLPPSSGSPHQPIGRPISRAGRRTTPRSARAPSCGSAFSSLWPR